MGLNPLTAKNLRHGEALNRDASIAVHIPYTRFLKDGLFVTRNNDVCAVFELQGIAHELLDEAELDVARASIARAISNDGNCAVYTHTIRTLTSPEKLLKPVPGDGFDAVIDERYRSQIATSSMYRIRHFITLVRRPPIVQIGVIGAAAQLVTGLFSKTTDEEMDAHASRRRGVMEIETFSQQLIAELERFGIRRLGGSREDRARILQFLSMLTSGVWNRAPVPADGVIPPALPNGRMTFGGEMFTVSGPSPEDNRVGAAFAIQAYDEQTHAGVFDDLLTEDFEFIMTQCFRPLDRRAGAQKAKDARTQMKDAKDDATNVIDALDDAIARTAGNEMVLGYHHFSLTVFARNEDQLIVALSRASASMGISGLKLKREDLGLEAAWFAQLPGNFGYQARRDRLISNENFADFCSFHTHPTGALRHLPWGAPVTIFNTAFRTPFAFSFHSPIASADELANGNTAVFGPPGSGKSAMIGFLASQTRRLKQPPRLIVFDKDRGLETLIRALNGEYLAIGPNSPIGLNPFSLIDDADGAVWLSHFVSRLSRVDLTPEQRRRISQAAERNAKAPAHLKTFKHFMTLLASVDDSGGTSLNDQLRDWVDDGSESWLFDHPEDHFTINERAFGIDMASLLKDDRTRSAALDYIFYRIEQILVDGYPTLIVLDEGWALLNDATFAKRVDEWLRTVRKLNAAVIFMTQQPADAAKSVISDTLIQSVETLMFFANPRANTEAYIDAFKLSDLEYDIVKRMPREQRGILIKQSAQSVIVRGRIADRDTLKVVSGDPKSAARMNRIRETSPDDWLDAFLRDENVTPFPERREAAE